MNKITVAFSIHTDGAIGSKIIAASENRNYSHALVILPLEGMDVIFQASRGMVNMIAAENFLKKNTISVSYDYYISDELFTILKTNLIKKLGTPYGTTQLIWIGFMKLLQIKTWPAIIYKKITNGESEEICSELVSGVVQLIDPCVDFSDVQLDFITPSDLDKKLLTQGSWKWREDGQA